MADEPTQTIDPAVIGPGIAKAREAGFSDEQIADHLAKALPGIAKAREAGFSNKDILVHLSGGKLEDPKEGPGVIAGFQHGVEGLANSQAQTEKQYLGLGNGPTPETPYTPANITNGSYNPLNWNYSQIPAKAAEIAPALAQHIAAAKLGSTVGGVFGPGGRVAGGLIGTGLSLWNTKAGDAAKAEAVRETGDPNAEPTTAQKARAAAVSAASSAVETALPMRFLPKGATPGVIPTMGDAATKYLTTLGVAGGTGAAGNAIDQVGNTIGTDKGVAFDPKQSVDAALGNMAVAGTLALPGAARDANVARKLAVYDGQNLPAAQAYFKRLVDAAGDNGLKNGKNAFTAQENTKTGLKNELNAIDDSTFNQDTQNSLKLAREGKTLMPEDVARIEAADPAAGFLARQLHMAQTTEGFGSYDTAGKSWAGGLSGLADKYAMRPLKAHALLGGSAAILGGHMLGSYGLPFLGTAAGAYAGSRLIDGLTGARSPANTFAKVLADMNAQTRLQPQAPPAAPNAPPPNQPWGPVPPATGPTGPQVAPPAAPAPAPQPTQPWRAPQITTLPRFNPMALAALAQKLKAGLPPEAPAPAPEAPKPAWQKPTIGEEWAGPNKFALAALAQKLKAGLPPVAPEAPPAAPKLPWAAPKVAEGALDLPAGFASTLKSAAPELPAGFASILGKAMPNTNLAPITPSASAPPVSSMADVLKNFQNQQAPAATAAPAASAAPVAPKKITKQDGNVQTTQPEPQPALAQVNGDAQNGPFDNRARYRPLSAEEMPYKGKSNAEIADAETNAHMLDKPDIVQERYKNRILDALDQKEEILKAMGIEHPSSNPIVEELMHQLNARSGDREIGKDAIAHYANLLGPTAGAALKSKFDTNAMRRIYETAKERKSRIAAEQKDTQSGSQSKKAKKAKARTSSDKAQGPSLEA